MMTTSASPEASSANNQDSEMLITYRALVIDSGPIIRMTGLTNLRDKAFAYYTVPAVLQEIRDAKARLHLQALPFEIRTQEPSSESLHAVIEFSRKTGDLQSLSSVDLQVLALQYDLEKEGCGTTDHIRKQPKRKVGIGRVNAMGENKNQPTAGVQQEVNARENDFFEAADFDIIEESEESEEENEDQKVLIGDGLLPESPKTWAKIVNPTATNQPLTARNTVSFTDQVMNIPFGQLNLSDNMSGGQFSDADDDDFDPNCMLGRQPNEDDDEDDDFYAGSDVEISDEECDAYILDPEEVDEHKRTKQSRFLGENPASSAVHKKELQSDFPTLTASFHPPIDNEDNTNQGNVTAVEFARQQAEILKAKSLQPTLIMGKKYNSFRKYSDLLKPKEVKSRKDVFGEEAKVSMRSEPADQGNQDRDVQSRIIGGTGFSGQSSEIEDDGEGWITSTNEIRRMKAVGRLDPSSTPAVLSEHQPKLMGGPPICQRTACATTDFAMQNVILQMNLELLSVDGIKIRRLKNWVSRCGACFTVYSDEINNSMAVAGGLGKRLFCSRCGSDMLQRVACSVDAKTGRMRLHLSKKYKTNIRGTKFSLPKPGSNNRFQGDLLLREDQLLMGAWSQKVKKLSGGKSRSSASSIFGSDLAINVGCNVKPVNVDDIRVGFGRRNPNAATGGRERRGKKKKSGDKACGLRRY